MKCKGYNPDQGDFGGGDGIKWNAKVNIFYSNAYNPDQGDFARGEGESHLNTTNQATDPWRLEQSFVETSGINFRGFRYFFRELQACPLKMLFF